MAAGLAYAAPLAAKTAAVLDHAIEGEVSRETLIGLLVHHAEMPTPLQVKALAPIAKHMAGFGMPPSADRILETGDHTITLVFASRIQRDQQINFRFQWPASLSRSRRQVPWPREDYARLHAPARCPVRIGVRARQH